MIAIISTGLGLFNLFPIPVLDGGHILLYTIEGIIRRPLSRRVMQVANAIAYVLLNFLHHFPERASACPEDERDHFSSAWREPGTDPPVVAARTWLLNVGWRWRRGGA